MSAGREGGQKNASRGPTGEKGKTIGGKRGGKWRIITRKRHKKFRQKKKGQAIMEGMKKMAMRHWEKKKKSLRKKLMRESSVHRGNSQGEKRWPPKGDTNS